ncbi:MAG: alanyl-tRNA editing protein [Oscillospiraceae bacterium]|nr:alanyl-tRNA editing protein [Oscillospiraceae bacterium]
METVKLFYENAYQRKFQGVVLSCEERKGRYDVVLDRTAFYPEGGGQPADHGTLGGAKMLDVHEKDGVITHTCDGSLPVGMTVTGEIEWARRFDHMQQHSGEHIVSGMLCAAYHCDNTGFHLGADTVIIDYNADISWEGLMEIERRANKYIWEDHPFRVLWPTAEELRGLPYRSKKELTGQVRIAFFPGADMCACCGTHVASSGQVGLVKFLSCQKFRDGVRLELVCGQRALNYLSRCWEQSVLTGQAMSVKPQDSFAAVERMQRELGETRLRCAQLEEDVFARIAEEHRGRGDVLLIRPPMTSDAARKLCDAVSSLCGGRCAVFAGDGASYKYAVIYPGHDIRDFIKSLNTALNGRGGGRDGFAQGSAQTTEADIRAFFAR